MTMPRLVRAALGVGGVVALTGSLLLRSRVLPGMFLVGVGLGVAACAWALWAYVAATQTAPADGAEEEVA